MQGDAASGGAGGRVPGDNRQRDTTCTATPEPGGAGVGIVGDKRRRDHQRADGTGNGDGVGEGAEGPTSEPMPGDSAIDTMRAGKRRDVPVIARLN